VADLSDPIGTIERVEEKDDGIVFTMVFKDIETRDRAIEMLTNLERYWLRLDDDS